MKLPLYDDFLTLVREQRPLIDTRAPVEFNTGAFPDAVNLPLMTDEERARVGTCYKQQGNDAAVQLGHRLVNETVRRPRIQAWADFYRKHPNALIYCFRGGQRSQIAQRWLYEYEGLIIPRLKGGYKALRHFLLEQLAAELPAQLHTQQRFILTGRTGCGKTRLLHQLHHTLDLEALANHRGSAFGRQLTPQPTQITFENALAYALIQFFSIVRPYLVFEDEGKHIGGVNLPNPIYKGLYDQAQLIVLETPLATRVKITLDEYVIQAQAQWQAKIGTHGLERWAMQIRESINRIQKRLGGLRHKQLLALFESAWQHQQQTGDAHAHRRWIQFLLTDYYDPMYDYQLNQKPQPIVFKGEATAVREYLQQYDNPPF